MAQKRQRHEDEVCDSYEKQDFATVHRLCRGRAGTCLIAKKRPASAINRLQATSGQRVKDMARPGCEGGFRAREIDVQDAVKGFQEDRPPSGPLTYVVMKRTDEDFHRTKRGMEMACPGNWHGVAAVSVTVRHETSPRPGHAAARILAGR